MPNLAFFSEFSLIKPRLKSHLYHKGRLKKNITKMRALSLIWLSAIVNLGMLDKYANQVFMPLKSDIP